MAKISVRLPEELHQEFRVALARNRKSAQDVLEDAVRAYVGGAPAIARKAAEPVVADSQPRDVPARTIVPEADHFKPDFKGGKKR